MIRIMNGHATVADIESVTAQGGVASPQDFSCDIDYVDLDPSEQTTYDDAMGVIVQDSVCVINNTPYFLDIGRITSSAINEGVDEMTESTLDYTALSAPDQAKLDAFNQLIIDKCW